MILLWEWKVETGKPLFASGVARWGRGLGFVMKNHACCFGCVQGKEALYDGLGEEGSVGCFRSCFFSLDVAEMQAV